MSTKYIPFNNTSHLGMLPQSMAGTTDFVKLKDLKNKYAELIPNSIPSCLPILKPDSSSEMHAESKSSVSDKFSELPASQIAISKLNGSIKEHSVNIHSKEIEENVLSVDPNKTRKTSVVSINDSNPSKTVLRDKSEETCDFISVGSDKTASNSDDSSPSKTMHDGNSTEDLGFIDIDSVAKDTSNLESKVVVQVLPNVGCMKISALEHCIDVSDIPLENHHEERWTTEEKKQNKEELKSLVTVTDEGLPDNYQQDNVSSKALSKGKMRRNHAMNLHIRSGNGVRLNDIAHIVSNVEKASPSLLCFLHKILFGSYGGSNNETALSQTKQNILHFSGFAFSEDSETFQNKRKCLLKVPYQMLYGMCLTLLGKGPRTRNDSVEDLLHFMLKPTNNSIEKQQLKTNHKEYLEKEVSDVEKHAIEGMVLPYICDLVQEVPMSNPPPTLFQCIFISALPLLAPSHGYIDRERPFPIVLVQKLPDSFVKEKLLDLKVDSLQNHLNKDSMVKDDKKPEYARVTGKLECRTQLKDFPEVVVRVNKARRRIINLMHIFFYGRPGSDELNRLNILEFEGFTDYNERNFRRKSEFLRKLRIDELNQMCHIFSMHIKNCSKLEKVIKVVHFLQAQSLAKKYRRGKTDLPKKNKVTEAISKKSVPRSERKMESVQCIKKLKDFEKIRRNIECAPPEELTELNDLLFLMPSDNLEIHQRILDFPSSLFRENSPDFHSRRTLLYYMSFDIIKKISSILEITDWMEYANPQDLATTLLRFLMEMKPSVNIRPKPKPSAHKLRRKKPSVIHQPHVMRLQKDDSLWENNFNGSWHPGSSAIPNPAYIEGYHEERGKEDVSVVVRRITESSYSFTDLKNNEPVTVSDCKSEESLSLYKFIQHPSEKQLEVTIREMICTNAWSSTMGELINKVFHCYPKFDLTYRTDFIKSKAIEVLHEMQSNAKPFGDIM